MISAFWHLRKQRPFDPARVEVIEHLVGRAVLAVRHAGQFVHVARIEVADAPLPDLAVLLQGLERFHRLGQGNGAAPVQQIEVEPIGLEPLEAALAGRNGTFARGVVRIDLAHQEDVVPAAGHGFRQHLLGAALAVHLRRIDQPDTEIEPELDRRHLGRPLRLALAHAPGAEAQHRHLVTAFQGHVSHLPLLVSLLLATLPLRMAIIRARPLEPRRKGCQ